MRWRISRGQDHLKAYIRYQDDDHNDAEDADIGGEDDDIDLNIKGGCHKKHLILPGACCDRNLGKMYLDLGRRNTR